MTYTPWVYQIVSKKIKDALVYERPWLILERLGLEELPSEIFNLIHLDELVIIDNLIVTIPEEISKLKNLTRLCMFYNELRFLPPEIGLLTNLTHLDLSCNCIEALPTEINNLAKLEYLDLRFNQLPIPEEILARVSEPKLILEKYFEQVQPVG